MRACAVCSTVNVRQCWDRRTAGLGNSETGKFRAAAAPPAGEHHPKPRGEGAVSFEVSVVPAVGDDRKQETNPSWEAIL